VFDNPGGAVYGAIAVSALLAAESPRRETYPKTVAAVVITLILYWLAHSYAEFAGERLRGEGQLSLRGLAGTMLHEISLLAGAAIPLVPILVWWVADGSLSAAVSAAVWTSAAMIVALEVVAAVRAELAARDFIRQVALGALLGLLVVALKVLLH
jgi:hypothetical protein